MVVLLLAPYNDSIQLGQGFNSFLQIPCINGAVDIPKSSLKTQATRVGGPGNVSQIVSYSLRFVEKISDVVRSMNISAASSIKTGTVEVSGNSLTVDEAKFAASDMNAVISVRVINHLTVAWLETTTTINDPGFNPLKDVVMDNKRFFETYGDCYVSGFMEGGDLHGIVSVKVLDVSKKSEVEAVLKGQMNGSSKGEFTLSEGSGMSTFESALKETETTITVSWSGGGQIKPDEEEWTLESLIKAAAAFPSRVATCPQRTWAILTRYDNNRSFVEWAYKLDIKVPNFSAVQQYTSDLLDNYMEYKSNLGRLQAVMANPAAYKLSPYRNLKPVNLSVEALVKERKLIKLEMRKIMDLIDSLNNDPSKAPKIDIQSPEVWATRLPVPKEDAAANGSTAMSATDIVSLLTGFSIAKEAAKEEPTKPATEVQTAIKAAALEVQQDTIDQAQSVAIAQEAVRLVEKSALADICEPGVLTYLDGKEQAWVTDEYNKREYADFRFARHTGTHGGGQFNDAIDLQRMMVTVAWPQGLELKMRHWLPQTMILQSVELIYDQIQLRHGGEERGDYIVPVRFGPNEKIDKVIMGGGRDTGIGYFEIHTTLGNKIHVGSTSWCGEVREHTPFDGCTGLKGFWGASGDIVDKLGPIWGK